MRGPYIKKIPAVGLNENEYSNNLFGIYVCIRLSGNNVQ